MNTDNLKTTCYALATTTLIFAGICILIFGTVGLTVVYGGIGTAASLLATAVCYLLIVILDYKHDQ